MQQKRITNTKLTWQPEGILQNDWLKSSSQAATYTVSIDDKSILD